MLSVVVPFNCADVLHPSQFIGAGIVVAVLVFALFSMANTVKLLLWRRSIERSRKHRVRLGDLV